MFTGEILPVCSGCKYCKQTYYEWDTGYAEYGCILGNADPKETQCFEDFCPLKCKWQVIE